jgi:phosphatidylglycerophosphate synthase
MITKVLLDKPHCQKHQGGTNCTLRHQRPLTQPVEGDSTAHTFETDSTKPWRSTGFLIMAVWAIEGCKMYELQRRPIKLRTTIWSASAASALAQAGVTPNQVSVASTVFALAGAVAFFSTTVSSNYITVMAEFTLAALFIQLRLLCNMLDGMIAVENGKATKSGALYNEIPDRISDVLLLVSAGFAAAGYATAEPGATDQMPIYLGWLTACLSLMTAYIRSFGARFMTAQDFQGPMAKPHRMFALTVGSLASALEFAWFGSKSTMVCTLAIICAGTAYTTIKRTAHLKQAMERK